MLNKALPIQDIHRARGMLGAGAGALVQSAYLVALHNIWRRQVIRAAPIGAPVLHAQSHCMLLALREQQQAKGSRASRRQLWMAGRRPVLKRLRARY